MEAGYDGWTGKNTFSKLPGDSGCSDYLEKRVVNGIPYLGLGLGAQSFSYNTLAYNLGGVTKRMQQYLQSLELQRLPIQDLYHLSQTGAWGKFCSVSFYFGGIDLPSFEANFGLRLDEAFPDKVKFVLEEGLMELQGGGRRLQMTKKGKAHYGGVLALFYSPHIQKHLLELQGGELNAYLAKDSSLGSSTADPARPYVGNPAPRYERKRMKRQDPRRALPQDWTAENSHSMTTDTRRSYSDLASNHPMRQQPSPNHNGTLRYEFGNILFGGPCNQKCVFCIGQQLPKHLSPRNHREWPLRNLDLFVERMTLSNTKRIILTGTTTDPQLYKYEGELLNHLRESIPDAHISIHTNGLLAMRKLDIFNQYDTATISINSFEPSTFSKIHGVTTMPDIGLITAKTKPAIKLSCVLTADNIGQVESYIDKAKELGVKRIAFRHVFNVGKSSLEPPLPTPSALACLDPVRFHCDNRVFDIDGVEVTYWKFDATSGNSLNLFSSGLLSDEYLLSNAPNHQDASSV
jgi:hypothetical protein